MKDAIRLVGALTMAMTILAIPALSVCAFACGWHQFLKAVLIIATMIDGLFTAGIVWERGEE